MQISSKKPSPEYLAVDVALSAALSAASVAVCYQPHCRAGLSANPPSSPCSPRSQSPSPGLVAPPSIAISLSGVVSGIPNRDAINCSCISHSASDAQSSPHQPTSPCFSLPCRRCYYLLCLASFKLPLPHHHHLAGINNLSLL
ncbi:hypothetical protein M0R45_006906 [Rubus argutus]|uniref:Uncharacterized protein n=1 Tax=Rubus argutus TaxID=59490 RepID=A0AAW1YRX0_RUBAR